MITLNILLVAMGSIAQDTRLVEKTHEVKVKRDASLEIDEVLQNLNSLNYNGQINPAAQSGGWYPTTTGEMWQYTTPKRSQPVKLEEAVKLCTDINSKLWDEKPQLALGFSNIEPNANYWISDSNGAMAQYTKENPEAAFDDICTQVKLTTTSDDEEKEIEVTTVVDKLNPSKGCSTDEFTGLTLCLRPVELYQYANSKNYRNLQKEAQTIIQQEPAIRRLSNIQTELTTNNYRTSTEKIKIPLKLQTISNNIDTIKREDQKPFPDFNQIKTQWTEILENMQDLETISIKIASDKQIKELEEQMDNRFGVNTGHRAASNIAWTNKWNTINQNIDNIKIKIEKLEDNTNNVTEIVREPEHQEEEDQENAEPAPEPVEGYFKKFLQAYEKRQQSLQRFCQNWKLDCRVVVMGGMFMTGIGAACTILIIFITIQTCNTAKKVNRLTDYLDTKNTRKEQMADDQSWTEQIKKWKDEKDWHQKVIPIPNPNRNYALIGVIGEKLALMTNKTDEQTAVTVHNFENISSNWNTIRQAPANQEEDETIPMLETNNMP